MIPPSLLADELHLDLGALALAAGAAQHLGHAGQSHFVVHDFESVEVAVKGSTLLFTKTGGKEHAMNKGILRSPSDIPLVRRLVVVADIVEDLLLAGDRQRLQRHGALVEGPDGVLVELEAHLQGARPHGFVEHVAAGEVEQAAVELEGAIQ